MQFSFFEILFCKIKGEMIRYFAYLLVISAVVYLPVICTDISVGELSDNAFQVSKNENLSKVLINEALLAQEVCNDATPCQNGGICYDGACMCTSDYTGLWCDTPTWCTNGKCGYGSDVECVWDHALNAGECRCKKDKYRYLPKDRKCYECDCGAHGTCQVLDDALVCECEENYALKSSKCERCDCGPKSEKCSFDSRGNKVCECQTDYSPKTTSWSGYGTWCEICICGDHGKCRWEGDNKICDCEDGFRSFDGKCKDCICGPHGTCEIDKYGDKVCTCDYGYAEDDGFCRDCDCNLMTRRYIGIDCKFHNGNRICVCPPGFEADFIHCQDINECYRTHPCPANTLCINKPGTYECRCKEGFVPIDMSSDPKQSGCKDVDECLDFPCQSPQTRCVNSPGSYDCVCKAGYYSTSGNYGSSYKPAYNNCYETETQWRQATIALGVIFSVLILGMTRYILKHKRSS